MTANCAKCAELREEILNLQDRWACVVCGRTPDGGKSGDCYVSICHSCHRCNVCADLTCTTCGGLAQTVTLLRAEQERSKALTEALQWIADEYEDMGAGMTAKAALGRAK